MLSTSTLPFVLFVLLRAVSTKGASNQLIVSNRTGECISTDNGEKGAAQIHIGDYDTLLVGMACEQATGWDISPGSGSIVLSSASENAMDAGKVPGNYGRLKMWTSYPGLPAQTWYLTDDGRIALQDTDQCIDLGGEGLQTYTCTPGNENQAWYIRDKEVGHAQ